MGGNKIEGMGWIRRGGDKGGGDEEDIIKFRVT